MNASLASRSRAAASQPSASASSRSSRARSRALAASSTAAGRMVASMSLGRGDDREIAGNPCGVERLGRELPVEGSRAGHPLQRRPEGLERRPEFGWHVDSRLQPLPGRQLRRRPGVAQVADEADQRRDLTLGLRVPLRGGGPAGDDEQVRIVPGAAARPTAPRSRAA